MDALGKDLLTCRAVPLLVLLVCDLALDKQLGELSALRFALEWHQGEAIADAGLLACGPCFHTKDAFAKKGGATAPPSR